jgi:hypothetical protein
MDEATGLAKPAESGTIGRIVVAATPNRKRRLRRGDVDVGIVPHRVDYLRCALNVCEA